MLSRAKVTSLIAGAAATSLLVFGINVTSATAEPADTSTTTSESPIETSASGDEMFRAIYFGQGISAKRLSESASFSDINKWYDANNAPEAVVAVGDIIADIKQSDPSAFTAFKSGVASGDPRKVDSALATMSSKLKALTDQVKIEDADLAPQCGLYVAVAGAVFHVGAAVTAAAAAVTVTLAVGANIVYAQNWFWGGSSASRSAGQQLTRDAALADITDAFAGI